MTRILLLGSGGQVGWELQRALAPLGGIGQGCGLEIVLGRHERTPRSSPHLRQGEGRMLHNIIGI